MNLNSPGNSCKPAQWAASRGAVWAGVVEVAAEWLGPVEADTGAVAVWVGAVRAWLAGGGTLEAVAAAAAMHGGRGPWTLATGVRAGTAAVFLEAREAGRWPATAAIPFALSGYVHPLELAAAVLEDAAERSGRSAVEAWARWRELALSAGVIP